MWRQALHAFIASLFVLLAGCGGGGGGDAAVETPPPAVAPTIGGDGGIVSGAASGSTGVTVVVPPGALQDVATIRVAADSTGAPAIPTWFRTAGPMVAITPHGATFSEPVTVRLPAPNVTLAVGERLLIAKAQPSGEWEVYADTRLNGGQLEVEVNSFSIFVPVVVPFTVPFTTGTGTLTQPFAMSPITLTCDGVPCVFPERLRPMAVTATSSANGGYLPANCVSPRLSMVYQGGSSTGSILPLTPATSATVLRGSFELPTGFPSLLTSNPALTVQVRMSCVDSATNANSTLNLVSTTITTDSARLPAGTPIVREFPSALTQAAGDSPVLRAVFQRGASGATGSSAIPDYTAPTLSNQAEIYFERLSPGDSAWRIVAAPLQTEANPRPYNGRPWQYWSLDLAIGALTSADNGASYRVRACYFQASVTQCAISGTATLTVVQLAQLPSFTTQPRSMLIQPGQTASFTTQVSGTPAPTLQWQRRDSATGSDWANVGANGTAANYTTPPIALADNGTQFRLLATNSAGSVASDIATVSVNTSVVAPAITSQPMSISVVRGSEAVFAVNVSGTEALSYQWFKAGVAINGANAPQLKIANSSDGDAAAYTVTASNTAGTVTSTQASLSVTAAAPTVVAPSIQTQPAAVAVTEGNVATFAVGAAGSGPMTFQWRRNGSNIAGATAAAYTIAAVTTADAGNYSVVVGNSAGSATSQAATLAVAPGASTPVLVAPVIVTPPPGLVITAGMSGYLGVTAQGSGPLAYRWFHNGAEVSGQTGATYEIKTASTQDVGSYRVEVSNAAGAVMSGLSQVVLLGAPAVTTQPAAAAVTEGQGATFSVAASGDVLRYQWLRNGGAIAGADAASYTTPALALGDGGAVYSVIVYNGAGLVFSNGAVLTVAPAVVTPGPVNCIAAGFRHSCGVTVDGGAACWGYNSGGQIGNGTVSSVFRPFNWNLGEAVASVTAGEDASCALTASGKVFCAGIGFNGGLRTPVQKAGIGGARQVVLGSGFACALLADRSVWCWGSNSAGTLGNGGGGGSSTPVQVEQAPGVALSGITALSAGDNAACAIRSDASVVCWGVNGIAQPGSPVGTDTSRATPVANVNGARQLAVGQGHACALLADGSVVCWGSNSQGQLGNGGTAPNPTPAAVPGVSGATALASGTRHVCAVVAGGAVSCWGTGSMGNGNVSELRTSPTGVANLSGVVALAAGFEHTCALRSSGTLACWGANGEGQLGTGDSVPRTTPANVPTVSFALP